MIDFFTDNPWVLWVALAVVLAIVEMMSLDLVLLMFAIGALGAAVVSAIGAPFWVAVLVFGAISLGLLFFARPPMVRRLHDGPTLVMGHDALVGRTALVLEPVGPRGGRVSLGSEVWSARTEGDLHIDTGAEALVTRIDGATAVITVKEL